MSGSAAQETEVDKEHVVPLASSERGHRVG